MNIDRYDYCIIYLEKGEHDQQLKWPMTEMEIELSTTNNKILYSETICTRCGYTVNRLEGDKTKAGINTWMGLFGKRLVDLRDFVFLTVKKHLCTKIRLA